MNEPTTLQKTKESTTSVSESLHDVLADTYGLYLTTHNYHWNVEGQQFANLHKLFNEQYNELFQAVDVIAERIRALGAYVLPFEGKEIMGVFKAIPSIINQETGANAKAERMVYNLIEINKSVIESCQFAKNEAQVIVDDESENLMVERITAHQKALWMLKSIVK